jgi:hypothetical protein
LQLVAEIEAMAREKLARAHSRYQADSISGGECRRSSNPLEPGRFGPDRSCVSSWRRFRRTASRGDNENCRALTRVALV